MLNRFRNAFYGSSSTSDDLSVRLDDDYGEAVIGKRIRSALTRSSSFRDDLLSVTSKNRGSNKSNNQNKNDNIIGIYRGKGQLLSRVNSDDKETTRYSNHVRDASSSDRRSNNRANSSSSKLPKFRYSRPEFLQLRTDDEISVSADHQIRPIILPRDVSKLPWKSGYAECINAGKSLRNEDQAACHQDVSIKLSSSIDNNNIKDTIPWTYFGIFDGHAGTAVAVAAASQLHNIISEKLHQVADLLIALEFDYDNEENIGDDFVDCSSSPSSSSYVKYPQKDGDDQEAETNNKSNGHEDAPLTPTGTTSSNSDKLNASSKETNDNANESSKEQQLSSESSIEKNKSESNQIISENQIQENKRQQYQVLGTDVNEQTYLQTETINSELHLPTMTDIFRNNITVDSLIIGALESAFWDMDSLIAHDKHEYKMPGGCTAIVSIFILGKLFVCNAGDSRAIVYKNNQVIPMSFDFTPISERERILRLGLQRPEFLGNEFTHLEFAKRPTRRDLGKQMLYRDAYMTGWSMKTITYDDLRFPLVWGEGKRSRVLATIGVTRGFGDHELRAQYGSVLIKPFLTPEPEVKILPLENDDNLTSEDVLIMGSDGLWDVTSNEEAAEIVKNSFDLFPDNEESRSKYRYITAAQDLVINSRGHTMNWNNIWRKGEHRLASLDDIAVFVIPLKQYKDEYLEWKRLRYEAVGKTSKNSKVNKLVLAQDNQTQSSNSSVNDANVNESSCGSMLP